MEDVDAARSCRRSAPGRGIPNCGQKPDWIAVVCPTRIQYMSPSSSLPPVSVQDPGSEARRMVGGRERVNDLHYQGSGHSGELLRHHRPGRLTNITRI